MVSYNKCIQEENEKWIVEGWNYVELTKALKSVGWLLIEREKLVDNLCTIRKLTDTVEKYL